MRFSRTSTFYDISISYLAARRHKTLALSIVHVLMEAEYTGCSLNIVFFSKILKYSELLPFSVFPRRQCMYTHQAGRTPAELAELRKITKHNI